MYDKLTGQVYSRERGDPYAPELVVLASDTLRTVTTFPPSSFNLTM